MRGGLLPHHFTLTVAGGIFSVALSVALLLLAVSQRHVLRCPDFPLFFQIAITSKALKNTESESFEISAESTVESAVLVSLLTILLLLVLAFSFSLAWLKLLERVSLLHILIKLFFIDDP